MSSCPHKFPGPFPPPLRVPHLLPLTSSMAAAEKLRASTISQDHGLHVDRGNEAPETVPQPSLEPQYISESQYHGPTGYQDNTAYEARPKVQDRDKSHLRPLTFWLLVAAILVLVAALAVSAGLLGSKWSTTRDGLAVCQSDLSSSRLQSSACPPPKPDNTTTLPGESYASSCRSMDVWRSNLTRTDWTQVCQADISHETSNFNIITGAVVPTFDACIRMCDALNWMNRSKIDVIAWSWSGNSSAGIQANTDGQCWCVEVTEASYSMNLTLGIDCALRGGTWDAGTVGTVSL